MKTSENSPNEIDTVYGKKLIITCVERKYRIVDSKSSFVIVAKKEFDEDTTEKLLHEDMELKTFLANYEIANITFPSFDEKNINVQKKKVPEIKKPETVKKEENENVKKRRDIITNTLKRRDLFDSLDLPDEFLVKDYIEAIEKNGMKISNSAMPYDDLRWLSKKGRVKMIKKAERGVTTYKKIKNDKNDEMKTQSDEDQSNVFYDESILPSKQFIDRHMD